MAKIPATRTDRPGAASVPMDAAHARRTRRLLSIICFFAGASVMVIEITANRLLAPSFGNSIYTWTALIGVVLVAISAGGYLGGWLSDKLERMDLLAWLLAGAAILTMLIPALNSVLSPHLAKGGLIAGPVFISLLLFALPGVLLGAVSPASVRFYSMANQDQHVGVAAGVISMLGSLGSFVGTFVSGFFLLSAYGVKAIFLGSGLLLLLLAFLAFWMARKPLKLQASAAVLVVLAGLVSLSAEAKTEPGTIHRAASFYHQIEVVERETSQGVERYLKLDSTMEGGMRMKDGALVLDYQNYWKLAQLNPEMKIDRALFIGAGAFGMPEEVSREHRDAHVDVVEIDPAVIETGRRFFKLDEHPNVHAHAGDARRYLNETTASYDLIFGDAYNGVRHIPAHLVTREFFTQIKGRLAPNGVFLMNVISAVQGPKAELLDHILATIRSVFPHVEAFAVGGPRYESQNVILLATQESWKPWLEDQFFLPQSWQGKLLSRRVLPRDLSHGGQVFTDDWNAVDAVIARQLLR